jgi:hypothetical protein
MPARQGYWLEVAGRREVSHLFDVGKDGRGLVEDSDLIGIGRLVEDEFVETEMVGGVNDILERLD